MLRKLSVLFLIGTIGSVATVPAAFAQTAQVLSPGGRTLAGPATQASAGTVWRSTAGINICVSVVPSGGSPYTLSLLPGGGSRSQTGPTSMCAEAQTSVNISTSGQPVTWRVDKSN